MTAFSIVQDTQIIKKVTVQCLFNTLPLWIIVYTVASEQIKPLKIWSEITCDQKDSHSLAGLF